MGTDDSAFDRARLRLLAERDEAEDRGERYETRLEIAKALVVIGQDYPGETLEQLADRVSRERPVVQSARAYFTAYRTWEREGGPADAKNSAHAALLAAVLRSFPEVAKP